MLSPPRLATGLQCRGCRTASGWPAATAEEPRRRSTMRFDSWVIRPVSEPKVSSFPNLHTRERVESTVASLGHIVVGMAAARAYAGPASPRRPAAAAMLFWAALSFLPDADVIGFSLGVRYEDAWGHRGATHSLMFAIGLGAVVGLAAPRFGRPMVRTGGLAALVV